MRASVARANPHAMSSSAASWRDSSIPKVESGVAASRRGAVQARVSGTAPSVVQRAPPYLFRARRNLFYLGSDAEVDVERLESMRHLVAHLEAILPDSADRWPGPLVARTASEDLALEWKWQDGRITAVLQDSSWWIGWLVRGESGSAQFEGVRETARYVSQIVAG